jgi:hypothetical protein
MNDVVMYKLNLDLPIISQQAVEKILDYIAADLRGTAYLMHRPNTDELALVYSMQAGINRMYGRNEAAMYMFEKGRALLADKFFDVLENFTVAACFVFLAMYCGANNEIERANFFLLNVQNFLNNWKESPNKHPCFDFLAHMHAYATRSLLGDSDVELMIKEFITHHYMVKDFYQGTNDPLMKIIATTDLPVDIEKIRQDTRQEKNNYQMDVVHLQKVTESFSIMYERLRLAGLSPGVAMSKQTFFVLFLNAIVLQKSLKAGDFAMARDSADKIARATTTADFSYLPSTVAGLIAAAAKCHIDFARSTANISDLLAIAESMREELLTLIALSEKTKLIKMRCESIITDLTSELRRIDDIVSVARFETYLTRPMEPIPISPQIPMPNNFVPHMPMSNELLFENALVPFQEDEIQSGTFDELDAFFNDFVAGF